VTRTIEKAPLIATWRTAGAKCWWNSNVLTHGGRQPNALDSDKLGVAMVEIQPIRVEIEREVGGRMLASVPELPGVMAYGASEDEAVRKVKSLALQVLADMIGSGEDVPEPLKALFAA